MNIIVTGSLGHISKPLSQQLIAAGHAVTVISSDPGKQDAIEALGAKSAIGSIEDPAFLTRTFTGADLVYCMEPPVNFFDPNTDILEYYNGIARSYATAIRQSGVKQVVHLSSIGAHTDKGNGLLLFHYNVEQILKQLPEEVAITTMRPVGFYYNLFGFIDTIKKQGVIATNYNADYKEPWVSPADIADAIAEEISLPFRGRKIRYVASDELSGNEIAGILGAAIGRPDLQWVAIPDEDLFRGLKAAGMTEQAAKGLVKMNAARHSGELFEDYFRHRPQLGKVKMTDFAKDFAAAFNRE